MEFHVSEKNDKFRPVDGEFVGYVKDIGLFVHRSITDGVTWCVSELESGLKVAAGDEKKEVIEVAQKRVVERYDETKSQIKKFVEKTGKSPNANDEFEFCGPYGWQKKGGRRDG